MQENAYKNIFHYMEEAVWIWDKNEKTIYANPKFLSLVEYTFDEILGKESYIMWDKKSTEIVRRENKNKRAKWQSSIYFWNLLSKTWKIIPVKLSGTARSDGWTIGIMRDLRELNTKKENEKIFLQVVEQSNDAIILTDEFWKIISWNNGAEKIFGYKKKIIGQNISLIFHEEDCDILLWKIQKVMKVELNGKNKKQDKIALSVTRSLVISSFWLGKKSLVFTCQDISNYRKIESDIQEKYLKIQSVYSQLGIVKRQLEYIIELSELSQKYGNNLKKLSDYIVASILMITKVDGCELLLLDNTKNILEVISHIGFNEEWNGSKIIPYSGSLTQKSLIGNKSLKIFDISSEVLYSRQKLARKNWLSSLLVIPLKIWEIYLGSLCLYTHTDAKLEIFENEFIEKYASIISLTLLPYLSPKLWVINTPTVS